MAPTAVSLASHIRSNSSSQFGAIKIVVYTNLFLTISMTCIHLSSKLNITSFSNKPHFGLVIFDKSFINVI